MEYPASYGWFVLTLSCTQDLKFFPDEILPEWHITWLRLDENKIRHLPRKMGHLTDLTVISVVGNQLGDLPETLTALKALTTLLIDNNEFKSLPAAVCNITTLAELSVTNNELKSLSEDIGNLQRLQTVRLQGNPELTHLPLNFGRMKNLKSLEFDAATVASPGGSVCPVSGEGHFAGIVSMKGKIRIEPLRGCCQCIWKDQDKASLLVTCGVWACEYARRARCFVARSK